MSIGIFPWRTIKVPDIIEMEINKLHENHKLYGSRYMAAFWPYEGKIEGSTDWDFAFPYEGNEQKEVKKAKSLGWTEKATDAYKDNLHFKTWEKIIGGHKVQMCSKINLSLFIKTYYDIDPCFYWEFIHKTGSKVIAKEDQKKLFNQFYKMKGW